MAADKRVCLPADAGYRMPAEWEPHEATWLAWPQDPEAWTGQLDLVKEIYVKSRSRSARTLVRRRGGSAIHPADAAHARSQGAEIDDEIQVGEQVGPFVVIAASGKSHGEVALYWPERKLLVVGDAVIGNPPGRCGLLGEQVMDDPPRLRTSVRALLDLDFDSLLPGDGKPILQGARACLKELVETFPK